MSQVRLLDSIFTRLVAWAIAICIAVVLILGALVGAKFEQLSSASQQAMVDDDLATLLNAYRSGGPDELADRIHERLTFSSRIGNAPHFLLQDKQGKTIAGDLPDWPSNVASNTPYVTIDLPGGRIAHARTVDLAGGRLLVAREATLDEMILNEIGFAFVAGGLFVVLAVGVAGRMTTVRLARRVKRISEAFQQPDEIHLERLNKGRGAADEIGELTRLSSEALQRLNRLVGSHRDTTDQIAHEMRTPLMLLDNRLFSALKTAPDETTARSLVEARREIRSVIAMLESLLDISHSEAHRGDPRGLSPVDLSDMLEHIAELYAASAEETGHRFDQEIAPGISIPGEEMQLTRLVTNLLDNAFKYVPPGGTVHLSLQPGPVITVSDTGPGIAPEDRETIFERFQRGTRTDGSNGGSGLGLALARAIARRHGMRLVLLPTVRGACFQVKPDPESDET